MIELCWVGSRIPFGVCVRSCQGGELVSVPVLEAMNIVANRVVRREDLDAMEQMGSSKKVGFGPDAVSVRVCPDDSGLRISP